MKLRKIRKNEWEIPKSNEMNVPAKIFANEKILEDIKKDKTIEQIKNVAKLPGIIEFSYAMPDAHQGYGFSIGGVAAFDAKLGIISPGGVGYDINCGIRLLKTNTFKKDIIGKEKEILESLFKAVPSGIGGSGSLSLKEEELNKILIEGSTWMLKNGYATKKDLENTEENGKFPNANPSQVSPKAKKRGLSQIGSLGAGNHFLEILIVDKILEEKSAKVLGLKENQIVILIHSGSRGLGHQVASDYIELMQEEYSSKIFNKDLTYAPLNSKLGRNYLQAMAAAANFAFANRQLITYLTRKCLKKIFPKIKIDLVYDICHNIAKFETIKINNKKRRVIVLRKGATRAFGPKNKNIPKKYSKIGQPVLIPGSMGTSSYVLCGTKKVEETSLGSCPHGAGRRVSRTQMRSKLSFEKAKRKMEEKNIFVKSRSRKGLIEESPDSYKNIEEIIKITKELDLAKPVAKLNPLIVIIG